MYVAKRAVELTQRTTTSALLIDRMDRAMENNGWSKESVAWESGEFICNYFRELSDEAVSALNLLADQRRGENR